VVRKLIALSLFSATGCFAATFAKLPLTFETYGETGQYISRTAGFNLLINNQEAVFALSGKPAATIHISVSGASKRAIATGEELLPGRVNYFVGTDRSKWRTNVEQYSRVRVREILPSTDIIYYGNPKQPEYDLILRPGADPAAIHFRFTGTLPVLMPNGDLLLKTSAGEIVEHRPVIEQDGKPVEGRFRLDPNGTVGFEIARYDHTRELRIDPSITYSTYLGGTSNDSPNAIVLDSSGNAYIAGSTSSFNFPVTGGALQTSFPGIFQTVAFVAKLNSTGSGLIYTTFLGGTGLNAGDSANAIAVDSLGNAYVAGTTGSTNFPVTAGAAATTLSGPTDGFVTKLNPTGTALVYSTFVGGTAQESIAGIAIDSSGDAFIAGSTGSTNFPVTVGAPQLTLKSANDAFVAKLNPAGSKLLYATYLGGTAEDDAYAIAADSSGNAYVTGNTASTDFPITSAAYKKTIGPAPVVFVVKINAAGTSFTYATYLGGTGGDAGNTIGVDSAGNVYIAGTTASADYPTTTGVISTAAPGISSYGHAFVTKLNPTGSALLYSTFLGGGGSDGVNGMAVDASGDAILTGFTYSTNRLLHVPHQLGRTSKYERHFRTRRQHGLRGEDRSRLSHILFPFLLPNHHQSPRRRRQRHHLSGSARRLCLGSDHFLRLGCTHLSIERCWPRLRHADGRFECHKLEQPHGNNNRRCRNVIDNPTRRILRLAPVLPSRPDLPQCRRTRLRRRHRSDRLFHCRNIRRRLDHDHFRRCCNWRRLSHIYHRPQRRQFPLRHDDDRRSHLHHHPSQRAMRHFVNPLFFEHQRQWRFDHRESDNFVGLPLDGKLRQ
jgi:hypothetical protein